MSEKEKENKRTDSFANHAEAIRQMYERSNKEYDKERDFWETKIGCRVKQKYYLLEGEILGLIPSFSTSPQLEVLWDNGAKTGEFVINITLLEESK